MLRPTAYLTVVLDEANANPTIASAIKRTYSYLAPTTIGKSVPDESGHTRNMLRMEVRLASHSYLADSSEEGNRTWNDVVAPWLQTKLDTLFGSVYEFNNETRRSFVSRIDYETLILVLEETDIWFALEPDSSLRSALQPIEAIRTWLASPKAQDMEIERFNVPSNAQRGTLDWFEVVLASKETLRIDA